MFTDPKRIYRKDPGHPKACPAFIYHKLFNSEGRAGEIEKDCKNAVIGCTECKRELGDMVARYLGGIRDKRKQLEQDKKGLWNILNEGAEKARRVALETINEVKEKTGLRYG